MQKQGGPQADWESEASTSFLGSEFDNWEHFGDDDIMHQQSAIRAEEAEKTPFVGDKVRATVTL